LTYKAVPLSSMKGKTGRGEERRVSSLQLRLEKEEGKKKKGFVFADLVEKTNAPLL